MKMDPKIDAFEISLHKLLGGAGLDQALQDYPQWMGELRPLLRVAQAARQVGASIHVPPGAMYRSRTRFLQAAAQRNRSGFNLFSFIPLHFGLVSVVLLLVMVLGGASALAASAQALPGDQLYPVKRLAEQGRLLLVQAPAERIELEQRSDHARLAEVKALVGQGRGAQVSFAGVLETAGAGEWRVAGLSVRLSPQGQVVGPLEPGNVVQIDGLLQPDGVVLAHRVAARTYAVTGSLQEVAGEQWTVAGVVVRVTPQTRLVGIPGLGSRLQIQAVWLADGGLLARAVQVLSPGRAPLPVLASSTPQPAEILETPPAGISTTAEIESGVETVTVAAPETEEPPVTPDTEAVLETERPPSTQEDRSDGPALEPTRTPKPEEHHAGSETPKPEETHEPDHTDEPEHTEEPGDDSSGSDHSPEASMTPKPTEPPDDD